MTPVEGDSELQSGVLEDLVDARNYRRWLVGLAAPFLGEDPLEIGSGLGHYAAEWVQQGVERWTASEAEPSRLSALRARFQSDPRVSVRELVVPIEEASAHSAVVAYNVLEHIRDDVGALRAFAGLLRSGGRVVLVVPAFPSAMSRFDKEIGHHRRYRRRSLSRAAEQAGLEIEKLHYVNMIGLIGWYILVTWRGGRPRAGFALTFFDRVLVPVVRRLEARNRPPFGQSLFLVARKP